MAAEVVLLSILGKRTPDNLMLLHMNVYTKVQLYTADVDL
jgi:hypothetical protein